MKEIKLGNSQLCAIVDDEFYDIVMSHTKNWWTRRRYDRILRYKTCVSHVEGKSKILKRRVKLHHLIIGTKESFVIDHINRNPLDNRRVNLRFVTAQQNKFNSGPQEGRRYKGVYREPGLRGYFVDINFTDPVRGIKRMKKRGFATPEAAALFANQVYREYYGEHAFQNIIKIEGVK